MSEDEIINQMRLRFEHNKTRYALMSGLHASVPIGHYFIALNRDMFPASEDSIVHLFPVGLHAWMRDLARRAVGDANVTWSASALMLLNDPDAFSYAGSEVLTIAAAADSKMNAFLPCATARSDRRLVEFTETVLRTKSADGTVTTAEFRLRYEPDASTGFVWKSAAHSPLIRNNIGCPAIVIEVFNDLRSNFDRIVHSRGLGQAPRMGQEQWLELLQIFQPERRDIRLGGPALSRYCFVENCLYEKTAPALYAVWADLHRLLQQEDELSHEQFKERIEQLMDCLAQQGYVELRAPL